MQISWSFSPSSEFYDCSNSQDIHRDSKFSSTHSKPVQKSSPFLYSFLYLVSSGIQQNIVTYEVIFLKYESMRITIFYFLGMVIFASLVYYAERLHANPKNDFKSIPEGLWWELTPLPYFLIRFSPRGITYSS